MMGYDGDMPIFDLSMEHKKKHIRCWTGISAANNHIVFEDSFWLRITFWELYLHPMEYYLPNDMQNYTPNWFESHWSNHSFSRNCYPAIQLFRSKNLKMCALTNMLFFMWASHL